MIIKEFRIIIPQSVEEYQIGQLYTIQKKSKLESVGAGSGVEIIENRPYESQKEKGQYTLKVYHVDERLPAGLKTLSKLLFPKSALLFEEESWNCYPYTRTKYRHKMFKGFNIDIESKYLPDYGQSDNVFGLSKSELNSRSVEYIDIVNDPINPTEYKPEEDPLTFVSAKTNRGPLPANWLDELKKNANTKEASTVVNKKPIRYMCSYKLCRIECAIWGCQSRLEKSISESVLRSMIQISHRQAWCWQDEYIDLSIEDVRKLERETQLYLEAKMRNDVNKIDEMENKFNNEKRKKSNASKESASAAAGVGEVATTSGQFHTTTSPSSVLLDTTNNTDNQHDRRKTSLNKTNSLVGSMPSEYEDIPSANDEDMEYASRSRRPRSSIGGKEDHASNNEFADIYNDDNDSMGDYDSSDDRNSRFEEFYDAISQASFQEFNAGQKTEATVTVSADSTTTTTTNTNTPAPKIVTSKDQKQDKHPKKQQENTPNGVETSSNKRREKLKNQLGLGAAASSLESPTKVEFSISGSVSPKGHQTTQATKTATMSSQMSKSSSQSGSANSNCKVDVLMIVVHGGNVTCTDTSKQSDFANFRTTLDGVIQANYSSLLNRVAYRLVTCEPICREALIKLAALSPMVNEQAFRWNVADDDDFAEVSAEVFTLHENLPFNCLPLLAMASQSSYRAHVCKLIHECNQVYKEFVSSEEGHLFQGQVCIVGDSLGSLLVYDALTHSTSSNGGGGGNSLANNQMNSKHHHHSSNSNEDVSSLNQSSNSSTSQPYTIQPLNRVNSSQSPGGNNNNNLVNSNNNRPQISIKDSEGNEEMDDDDDEDEDDVDDLPPEDLCMMKSGKNKKTKSGVVAAANNNSATAVGVKRHASIGSTGGGGGGGTSGNTTSMFEFSMPYLTPQQQSPVLAQRNMTLPVTSPMSGHFSQNSPGCSPFFSASIDETTTTRFDFDVMHFFVFGSPLGLVLAYKKLANNFVEAPSCSQIYNLFHLTDPIAVRVEPTLCKQFRFIEPCMIPRYTKFPLGDGANTSLDHFIVKYGNLFETNALIGKHGPGGGNTDKNNNNQTVNSLASLGAAGFNDFTNSYLTPNFDQLKSLQKIMQTKSNWWGENRVDYVLYAPEKLANLPKKSLPYLFHSCFWESNDVASFIVRALFKSDYHNSLNQSGGGHVTGLAGGNDFKSSSSSKEPVEKWQRRMNRVKLRNLSSNHRANDVIVLEDKEQVLAGKFSYGPLDFALSGEQVDIYIASKLNSSSTTTATSPSSGGGGGANSTSTPPPVASTPLTPTAVPTATSTAATTLITSSSTTNSSSSSSVAKTTNNWKYYASGVTDNHGRLRYILPADKRLSLGMYQVKMVVKCDHTSAEFNLAVLPANTEAVVFSIDGSFAANISFSGTDPKVRAGAVDVVRHWQDLGYLIIYITARPDIQHYKVTNWLAQHNFPFGMVYFSDGLSRDPIKQKTETLRSIVKNNSISLQAAYGSAKDVPMYASMGLPATRIFMIGKPKAKYLNNANVLKDGYASHLSMLQNPNSGLRQATGNARLFIKKNNLTLRHNTMYSSVTNLNTLLHPASTTTPGGASSGTQYRSFHNHNHQSGGGGGTFSSNTLSPYTRSASTNQLNNQS